MSEPESYAETAAAAAKPTVFFHVMKCGGTAVRAGLTTSIAGCREGPGVFELDGPAAARAAGGTDRDNWRFRDALLAYVLHTMRPAIAVGHFRYRDAYEQFLGRAHFVTVLREPLDRLVSLYKYRRYKKEVQLKVSVPFDELIQSGRWSSEGCVYVHRFCGRDDLDPRSDEACEAAVANLRRFAVVGRLDRLDEFAQQVSSCTGHEITIPVRNTSPAPESTVVEDDLDERSLAAARQLCEPDVRLYERVFRDESA